MATIGSNDAPARQAELGVVARLGADRKKFKSAAKNLAAQRDKEKARADQAERELEELKKAAPDTRIRELEAELRTVRHRTTFDRIAIAEGADPDGLDDLFALSGYQAKDDKPDEKAIKKLLGEQKEHPSRRRFFQAAGSESESEAGDDQGGGDRGETRQPAPTPTARAVPGGGRGGRAGKGAAGPVLTKDHLADPKFMLDPRNKELIYEAARNKGFRLPDREAQRGPQG